MISKSMNGKTEIVIENNVVVSDLYCFHCAKNMKGLSDLDIVRLDACNSPLVKEGMALGHKACFNEMNRPNGVRVVE